MNRFLTIKRHRGYSGFMSAIGRVPNRSFPRLSKNTISGVMNHSSIAYQNKFFEGANHQAVMSLNFLSPM
jgi:hypothetical protein